MYRAIVEKIKNRAWGDLTADELIVVMILSAFAAREFAESLRIALELYPDSLSLREMADGELDTNNLCYGGYSVHGDHANFLWHFIEKYELTKNNREAILAGEKYLAKVRTLSDRVRAMSIFSRERELPGIFGQVLTAKDWERAGLDAFHYYMKTHIDLDSQEGGHADLTSAFEVTEEVTPFYEARLDLYRCIPKLFS